MKLTLTIDTEHERRTFVGPDERTGTYSYVRTDRRTGRMVGEVVSWARLLSALAHEIYDEQVRVAVPQEGAK